MEAGQKDSLALRKGVAAGSFLDLLMRATDKTTGAGFSDIEIANQAFTMLLAGFASPSHPTLTPTWASFLKKVEVFKTFEVF